MSFSMNIASAWRPLTLIGIAFGLSVPVAHVRAQFGQGDAVSDWMNKALPNAYNSLPNYSSSATTSGVAPSSIFSTSNSAGVQSYQLGVYKERDLDVGMLVRDVQPGSPAARFGLKKDDLIVTVNGQQVGNTPRGFMDVGVVINQLAINGRVLLLVADGLTGKLKNVQVDLAQTTRKLEGRIQLPDSRALMSSYMIVTLKNLNRPLYDVAGGKISNTISGAGPWSFSLQIDPQSVSLSDQYQLQVEVLDSRNILVYASYQNVDVGRLMNGSPSYEVVTLQPPNTVQAAYNPATLGEVYKSVMGVYPAPYATQGWGTFLRDHGNNYEEMRIALLSHAAFYEQVGNDPQRFIESMIRILSGRNPTAQEVGQWMNRLQQNYGQREPVVREFMAQNGSGSQLR